MPPPLIISGNDGKKEQDKKESERQRQPMRPEDGHGEAADGGADQRSYPPHRGKGGRGSRDGGRNRW